MLKCVELPNMPVVPTEPGTACGIEFCVDDLEISACDSEAQAACDSEPQAAAPGRLTRVDSDGARSKGSSQTTNSHSSFEAEEPFPWLTLQRSPVFLDPEDMKRKVRGTLTKNPFRVYDLYKDNSCMWARTAKHPWFEHVTLGVIAVNAVWIAIDADQNDAEMLLDADPVFQVAENFFCLFFTSELMIRFLAFRRKRDVWQDGWFVFDFALVLTMVFETWLMCLIVLLSGGTSAALANASILRIWRLLRLTRMARMARLLRAMPELMIFIKGMVAAVRSVFFTLCLLFMATYIFAIAFTQIAAGTNAGKAYFSTVMHSMYTLLVHGTLLDEVSEVLHNISHDSVFVAGLFLVFVLVGALTIMNMLIGVLCEVVSAVASVEKEAMAVNFVTAKLKDLVQSLDVNGDCRISKDEFQAILESQDATKALQEVNVDPVSLVDFADFIFKADYCDNEVEKGSVCSSAEDKHLTFKEFMDMVLQLRGTNQATVKDIVMLRKVISNFHMQIMTQMERGQLAMKERIDMIQGQWSERKSSMKEKEVRRRMSLTVKKIQRRRSHGNAEMASEDFSRCHTLPDLRQKKSLYHSRTSGDTSISAASDDTRAITLESMKSVGTFNTGKPRSPRLPPLNHKNSHGRRHSSPLRNATTTASASCPLGSLEFRPMVDTAMQNDCSSPVEIKTLQHNWRSSRPSALVTKRDVPHVPRDQRQEDLNRDSAPRELEQVLQLGLKKLDAYIYEAMLRKPPMPKPCSCTEPERKPDSATHSFNPCDEMFSLLASGEGALTLSPRVFETPRWSGSTMADQADEQSPKDGSKEDSPQANSTRSWMRVRELISSGLVELRQLAKEDKESESPGSSEASVQARQASKPLVLVNAMDACDPGPAARGLQVPQASRRSSNTSAGSQESFEFQSRHTG